MSTKEMVWMATFSTLVAVLAFTVAVFLLDRSVDPFNWWGCVISGGLNAVIAVPLWMLVHARVRGWV